MRDFSFEGEFQPSGIFQTKSIALNIPDSNGNPTQITTAKIILPATSVVGNAMWFLSADGGSHWEDVSLNEKHTFSNPGMDLRLRIIGDAGAQIRIRQSDGGDTPIRVQYNV
jgi:hypothetical protein